MSQHYEIRDPIHGCIMINEHERLLIDHPWLQRLRSIKQLGFVSTVYPGAVHDRFQHSLGVMHLAGLMFDRLCADAGGALRACSDADRDYARTIVRCAGIVHDIGHAPFSHTSEAYFPQKSVLMLPADWYRVGVCVDGIQQACHEDMTLAIIHRLVAAGVLEESLARDVAAVLSPHIRRSPRLQSLGPIAGILRTLISGELDADRCDYLLRDSHFTGVSYGVYDLTRLLGCLRVLEHSEHGHSTVELGLDVHGVHPLESLLLARYHMFAQVYFHKTPPAFEYYLSQAVAEGEISFSLEQGVDDVVQMRDDSVMTQLHAAAQAGALWSRRIIEREPAKLILRERLGADHQENALADTVVAALRDEGCHVFTRQSHQHFTHIRGAGAQTEGQDLLCERRVLGRRIVESVTKHSPLLSSFNQPINLRHTYVLRHDADKAARVMERLQGWSV